MTLAKLALLDSDRRSDWRWELDPQTLDQLLDGSAYEDWNTDDLLARVGCPVLLLGNSALEVAEVKRAESMLANCRTVFIKNAGHMVHSEKPVVFSSAVRKIIETATIAKAEGKSFEDFEQEFFEKIRPTSLIKRFAAPEG